MKILLVDDSRTMRTIQKRALATIGYTNIDEVGDGQAALRHLQRQTPDLILLDWNMPRMDGLTFLKIFRQTNSDTPVIMVTTEAENSQVMMAIKQGADDHLAKPFTREALAERIAATLQRRDICHSTR